MTFGELIESGIIPPFSKVTVWTDNSGGEFVIFGKGSETIGDMTLKQYLSIRNRDVNRIGDSADSYLSGDVSGILIRLK